MVPSGEPTEETIRHLWTILEEDDIVIDGGNTKFHDDVRRAADLQKRSIHYVDAGTSGGIWGLQIGYCLMVGGEKAPVDRLASIFTTLAPENGWAHVGGHGAGHYVKMVHNGIEYSMMQGYAEGFELMSKSEYNLDLANICRSLDAWKRGTFLAFRTSSRCIERRPKVRCLKGVCAGFGRRTLDVNGCLR